MFTVKFLGGAKKSFLTEKIEIDKSNLAVGELLELLLNLKPENTPGLDIDNLLVAINGVDCSALNGRNSMIKENDVVSIIPVIHGGSSTRINLEIKGSEGRQQWVWIGNLPHEDSASPNFINDEDVELLHDKIDELFTYQTSQRNRLYLDWNRYVGLRGLEATSLKIHMIPPLEDFQEYIDQEKPFPMDFSPKKQGVRTKGGKDRPRPLDVDPMLLKHTRDYIDFVRPEIVDRAKTKFGRLYKESDALFLSTTGDTLGQQMKTKSMQEALREAIKAAGVKMKPHDLRRLFSMSVVSRLYIGKILRLKEKGHSINTIIATIDDNTIITYASQQLGHKFSSVTIKHYLDQTKLKLLKMSDEVRLEYLERHKFSSLAAIKEHETEEETEQQMKYKEAESAGLIDALKEGNKDKVFEILQQHVLK